MSDMEKTEAPTAKKRQEAREEGKIPKSQELTTAVLLLGGALVLNTAGRTLSTAVLSNVKYGLLVAGAGPLDGQAAIALMQGMGWKLMAALGVFLTSMAGVTLSITMVQARGVMASKALAPKWERLDPIANTKRMFGVQPWVELVKSLAKLALVGLVVHTSMQASLPDALALAQSSPLGFLEVVRRYSVRMLMIAGLFYLALAVADYFYQIWQHEQGLKMSKEEVKQESKNSDGDPLVKARMRSMARSLARRQMFQEVARADVVITNPTHIAVALRYDPEKNDAPMVIAMGQRKIAERIKAIARESGVPTVENRPLARALLGSARVGESIPSALYLAVAEVLAFVIRQRALGAPSWRRSVTA